MKKNAINGAVLSQMTDETFGLLNINVGDLVRIKSALQNLGM
jgi:hypothetical protein